MPLSRRHFVEFADFMVNLWSSKNILQVKIQKEFKTTPLYIEIEHDIDTGYHMGVYLLVSIVDL